MTEAGVAIGCEASGLFQQTRDKSFLSLLPDTPNGKCSLLLAIAMTIER